LQLPSRICNTACSQRPLYEQSSGLSPPACLQIPASMGSGTLSPTGHHGERCNSGGLASAHGSNAVLDAGGNGLMAAGAGNGNANMQVIVSKDHSGCPPRGQLRKEQAWTITSLSYHSNPHATLCSGAGDLWSMLCRAERCTA